MTTTETLTTGGDPAANRSVEEVAIAIALDRLRHLGLTEEELETAQTDRDHSGCDSIPGVGWTCAESDPNPHEFQDVLDDAVEEAIFVMEWLAAAGHTTITNSVAAADVARRLWSNDDALVVGAPGCTCHCHTMPGVAHVKACCSPEPGFGASARPEGTRPGCTGDAECPAPVHLHGCFSDTTGCCSEPSEHESESRAVKPALDMAEVHEAALAVQDYERARKAGTTLPAPRAVPHATSGTRITLLDVRNAILEVTAHGLDDNEVHHLTEAIMALIATPAGEVTTDEAALADIERIVERVAEHGYANDAEDAEWRAEIRAAIAACRPATVSRDEIVDILTDATGAAWHELPEFQQGTIIEQANGIVALINRSGGE